MNSLALNILVLLSVASCTFAQKADAIIGKYHLPNYLDIEIFKAGEKYAGKIIGLDGFNDGQEVDINNPDESKRHDPLLGKTVISDLAYDSTAHVWGGGKMYGPEKGLIFSLKITKIRSKEIEVVASKFIFRKNLTWQKL